MCVEGYPIIGLLSNMALVMRSKSKTTPAGLVPPDDILVARQQKYAKVPDAALGMSGASRRQPQLRPNYPAEFLHFPRRIRGS